MHYEMKIASLRDKQGYTQEELADRLGISRAALSHYEKNRREPDFETLAKLADLFKVTIDYLIGRTNHPQSILQSDVKEKVDTINLSEEDILKRFTLLYEGKKLDADHVNKIVKFIREKRAVSKPTASLLKRGS